MNKEEKTRYYLDLCSLIFVITGYLLIYYALGFLPVLGLFLISWGENINACRRLEKIGVKDFWTKI